MATLRAFWSRIAQKIDLNFIFLGLLVALNLYANRAMALVSVAYPNDSSVHQQMVRFASSALRSGHWPMTMWYPNLDLGSPQFLHYQGLPATLTGALGLVVTPNVAFRLSLYVMVALWPVVIYGAARVFKLPRPTALAAAMVSPFLASSTLVGYEAGAYTWIGYGVWAQLAGSMALPFAWAWSWRALSEKRAIGWAVFFIALTSALHFETGYSAFGAVVLMALVHPAPWRDRLRRGLTVLVGAGLSVSWVLVPLLVNARWAAINSALETTGLVRGYGARQNLSWLFHGQLLDANRLPILTVLLFIGMAGAIALWRRDPLRRAFATLTTIFFVISWGPTTLGAATNLLPGHSDIYFRRFLLSFHLGAIFLIGTAVAYLASWWVRTIPAIIHGESTFAHRGRVVTIGLALLTLAIAVPSVYHYQSRNEYNVHYQHDAEITAARDLAPIMSYLESHHDGRVYAGDILDWGKDFKVGEVPMYMYLAAHDIDQVGFLLRTAALMEQPEYLFDSSRPNDYAIMGIRYILSPNSTPPIHAVRLMQSGNYFLYVIPGNHYLSLTVHSGQLDANKRSLLAWSGHILGNGTFVEHVSQLVRWNATTPRYIAPTVTSAHPGQVITQTADLSHGDAYGTVRARETSVVVLSASFDPGWVATVDGVERPTVMIAPALVGVIVPPGNHAVIFRYHGYRYYPELLALSFSALAVSFAVGRKTLRVRLVN